MDDTTLSSTEREAKDELERVNMDVAMEGQGQVETPGLEKASVGKSEGEEAPGLRLDQGGDDPAQHDTNPSRPPPSCPPSLSSLLASDANLSKRPAPAAVTESIPELANPVINMGTPRPTFSPPLPSLSPSTTLKEIEFILPTKRMHDFDTLSPPSTSSSLPPYVNSPILNGNGHATVSAVNNSSPRPHLSRDASSMDRKPSLNGFSHLAVNGSTGGVASTSTASDRSISATPSGNSTPAYSDVGGSNRNTPRPERVKSNTGSSERKPKRKAEFEPQLLLHLPLAEDESARTYEEIAECTYASKALGNLTYFDDDSTSCDCTYDRDGSHREQACGDESQCINRLMQIECAKDDCKCGRHCQNQRFRKKQYAPIDVIRTEKKGFGVRAREDLTADQFVYEYLGEVIGPAVFARKMKEYASEGIRHFYFMALDKDIFIDATKKGGKGRFLNHSCNPNCFVAKWTVGKKMRMGIFTKRDIKMGEELTFNYNVDRYGHVAQPCFCGEANCVGFIGGKTQTDIGGMDDLYIDALGITEEVEALGLRGTKKKNGKKLDEDFTPILKPIQAEEVPKVAAAVRQAITTRRILEKLLFRIQITSDEEVQRQLLRLHGFNLMSHILKEYPTDVQIITLDLEILSKWPLITRNKVEATKIDESVRSCAELEAPKIKELAQNLLTSWEDLELGYRIPRAAREANEDSEPKSAQEFSIEHIAKRARLDSPPLAIDSPSRPVFVKPQASTFERMPPPPNVPSGWKVHADPSSKKYYYENRYTGETTWDPPRFPAINNAPKKVELDVNDIISKVQAEAEEMARLEAERKEKEDREKREKRKAKQKAASSRSKAGSSSSSRDLANKDKRVMALFSAIVVGVMSKYKQYLDTEQFKKRAREVTQLLCEKEKKHPLYLTEPYEKLTPEKAAKIKEFTKDWVKKLLARRGKGSSTSTPKSASTPVDTVESPSSSTATPKDSGSLSRQDPRRHPSINYSASSATTMQPQRSNDTELASAKEDEDLVASMIAELGGGGGGDGDEDEDMEDEGEDEDEGTPPGTPPRRKEVRGGSDDGTPPPPPPPAIANGVE